MRGPALLSGHVLVVDDNLTNQSVAVGLLQHLGLSSTLAADGQQALAALEREDVDLVFMDCQMPVMDGYEATRQIRSGTAPVRNPQIPIIAMTANAMQGDRENVLAAGMNDYLAKPMDLAQVVAVVRRWLPEAQATDNAAPPDTHTAALSPPDADADVEAKADAPVVFDEVALSERLMGDRALIRRIIAAFVPDMASQIAALVEQAAAGEYDQVARTAHKIKGAAANVGAMALSAQALVLEQAAKSGDAQQLRAGLEPLQTGFEALQRELTRHG